MFLTCKSFKIVHTLRKKNSSRLETVIALSQYTSPRYFAVKYSRYRGEGWLTSSRLLSTRSNIISKHLRWMWVDWIMATFFLHFSAFYYDVFLLEYRITFELLFEWHWREFPIAVSSIKLILFLVLFRIFLFIFFFPFENFLSKIDQI